MSSKAALRIAKFIGVTFRNQNVLTLGGCWHYKKHLRGQANTNGKQFEAQSESKSGYQAGDLLEQRNVVSCDYFTVQENAKTVVDLIETDEEGRYWLDVSEKKQISHDTIVLKFKFP